MKLNDEKSSKLNNFFNENFNSTKLRSNSERKTF
jgi:hypothetical protein